MLSTLALLRALALLSALTLLASLLALLALSLPLTLLLSALLTAVARLLLTTLSLLTLAGLGTLTSTLLALLTLPTRLISVPRIARRLRRPRQLLDFPANLVRPIQSLPRGNLTAIVAAARLALLITRGPLKLFHLIFQLVQRTGHGSLAHHRVLAHALP